MNKLLLSEDGIFPISKDINGNLSDMSPATGLSVSGTIQGEGKLAGVPSLFIRLAKCNLCCVWTLPNGTNSRCDTFSTFQVGKTKEISVIDALKTIKQNLGAVKHIVITGGEPLLQNKPLISLTEALKSETNAHLTLETNGTLFDENVAKNIDLFSISPKLKNSKNNNQKRLNIEVLQSFIDFTNKFNKDIQFKFVISSICEEYEIKDDFLAHLNSFSTSDILVMPLGATIEELEQTSFIAFEMAIKNGWRFSPRLHINLFNNKSGV